MTSEQAQEPNSGARARRGAAVTVWDLSLAAGADKAPMGVGARSELRSRNRVAPVLRVFVVLELQLVLCMLHQ